MPCDYSKYPSKWLTKIRPRILNRDKHRCKFCGVKNYEWIIRGQWGGVDCYQAEDGIIYDANDGERIGEDYWGCLDKVSSGPIKVILTVAHLNHDINDNRDKNLAALCQRCHNRHDARHRKINRQKTKEKNKGFINLFGCTI